MTNSTNPLTDFENVKILDFDNAYEPLFYLKKLSDDDFEINFISFMDNLLEKINSNPQNQKILKDIYFCLPVINFNLHLEPFFLEYQNRLAQHITDLNLLLEISNYAFKSSFVYAIHDGISLFHTLDKSDGSYDAFYYLGENDEEEHFYAIQNIDESTLTKFNNNELTLFELFTYKECSYIFVEKEFLFYEYRTLEKTDVDDFFSKIVTAEFFSNIWGQRWSTEDLNLI